MVKVINYQNHAKSCLADPIQLAALYYVLIVSIVAINIAFPT